MGTSTNGVLFYGYCWDEETEFWPKPSEDADRPDWDEILALEKGAKNPWDNYPKEKIEPLEYMERRKACDKWCEEHDAEFNAWYAAKKKCKDEMGCDIGIHCSCDSSMPYIHIVESEIIARRGYPEILTADKFIIGSDWGFKLKAFVQALKITPPQEEPSWWLVSL